MFRCQRANRWQSVAVTITSFENRVSNRLAESDVDGAILAWHAP